MLKGLTRIIAAQERNPGTITECCKNFCVGVERQSKGQRWELSD